MRHLLALVEASAVLGAMPAQASAPASGSSQASISLAGKWWLPPLIPVRVVRPFDPPATQFGRGHRGVDLAAFPGEIVRAPTAGIVIYAGPLAGRGVVSIRVIGFRTTFEPVIPLVGVGEPVAPGQAIATVAAGHPGCFRCLHWGLRNSSGYLDPMLTIRPHRVRLVTPHR